MIDGALLDRLDGLQARLEANIIGQAEVIPEVVKTIKNAELGFTEAGEPHSAFLFLGPTGVGKTEVTLQFTEYVCGPGKLIRLDMGEFVDLDAVGLLIGTPRTTRKCAGDCSANIMTGRVARALCSSTKSKRRTGRCRTCFCRFSTRAGSRSATEKP